MYDEGETSLRLNEVVEFVGVFSRGPKQGAWDPALCLEELAALPQTGQARTDSGSDADLGCMMSVII